MDLADRFAMLWEADAPPPDVFAFLGEHPGVAPRLCADVLLIDQHHRWLTGDVLPVEVYLGAFPAVADDPELKLDLVFSELRNAARARGGVPEIAPFLDRFPDLGDALVRQVEVADWLNAWDVDPPGGPGGVPTLIGDPTRPRGPSRPPGSRPDCPPDARPGPEGRGEGEGGGGVEGGAALAPFYPAVPGGVAGPERAPEIASLEILERLGAGGNGVVYRARQAALNRVVALKMIHAADRSDPKQLARFRTEVQAVARLSHPNFVQIYEIGEWDGLPYFVMEYVNGGSLERKLGGGPLPVRQAAQLVETLARAMGVAHAHGIVHRDLKPANILLTVDGQPKVTDFGLAKITGEQAAGPSRSGTVLGTPSYMAPEQARGEGATPSSDIYSLGATLYEMLTGRPPFRALTVYGTLVQVMNQEPEPPGRLRPKLPRDLETICLKCLEKEPRRRYDGAEALAEDLRAFLGGEPIRAREARPWERALRRARRSPGRALLLGVAAVASAALLLGIWRSNALVVVGVAVLGLVAGGSWYHARLRALLRALTQQQVVMERYAERLQMLGEMSRQLMAVTDRDQLLYLLGETAARLANAELATIYLIDRARGEVWSKAKLGNDIGEIRVPLGTGIAGAVAATGRMINLGDPYADARFNPEIDRRTGYKTRNLLTLPMIARGGEVVGVFQVVNKRRGLFEAEDEEVLAALAATAAVIIERARVEGWTRGPA